MDLKKYFQCSVSIQISWDLRVCFSLVKWIIIITDKNVRAYNGFWDGFFGHFYNNESLFKFFKTML